MRRGQKTSISIDLNIVQIIPNIKAKVILSQICDSLREETKGFSLSAVFSNSNSKP